jgi:hypothetical protein
VTTKYLAKFPSPMNVSWPKIIQPERISKLICTDQVYISFRSNYFWPNYGPWTLKFGQIFSCHHFISLWFEILTVYTHIPNIKSISQNIAKKSGDNFLNFWITDMGNTIYYEFSLLHIFSLVLQPWMSAYIRKTVFVTELTVVTFFVHAAVLSIKTAFNLVKIHLLFRIIPLIQWSVMFCRPYFNRFWGPKYILRLYQH